MKELLLKTHKKITAILLVVTMTMTLLLGMGVNVHAASPDPAKFTVTSAKGVSEKTVEIEVRVSDNSQITAGDWELKFDSSKLLFDSFEGGEIMEVGISSYGANVSDTLKVSFASVEPIDEGGVLFKATFLLTSEDYNEKIEIGLDVPKLQTTASINGEYSVKTGQVEVVERLYGDLDSNNRIAPTDVLTVLSSLTEEVTLTDEQKKLADVNGDGVVNSTDALQILYFTAEMGDVLYVTEEEEVDFFIYNIESPKNVTVTELNEYNFTVGWEETDYAIGYNLYFNGTKVNTELLKENSITIGGDATANIIGSELIPNSIHNTIDHNTSYQIEVSAVNSLKESDRSDLLDVTTKRHHSWITYKNWDGTVLSTEKVLFNQDSTPPNVPEKVGHDFTGWDKETTNIIDDAVITALFEIQYYDYAFYDWNNTEIATQAVAYEGAATAPEDPTKTGHTFVGWYTELDGGTEVSDFSNATGPQNFYARYQVNEYTVSFNSNGGNSVSSKVGDYGTSIDAPTAPTKYAYTFGGWYRDSSFKTKWDFNTTTISKDETLYAKWIPIQITVTPKNHTFTNTGQTKQLTAKFNSGSDTLKWTSSNTKVATVNPQTGLVTAVGHGTAKIYIEGENSSRRSVCEIKVDAGKTAWITADSVRLRSKPTTSSSHILATMPDGAQITIYGSMTAHGVSGQKGWYQAKYGSKTGYVSADYVSLTKPVPPPTIVPQGSVRTTAPTKSNKYYASTGNPYTASGLAPYTWPYSNYYRIGKSEGNCTWYVWGRVWEYWGIKLKVKTGAGQKYYNEAIKHYKTGKAAKVGAVGVWTGDYPHVAFVEKIENGVVYYSESSWDSTLKYDFDFRYSDRSKDAGVKAGLQSKHPTYYIYPNQPL